MIRRLLLGLIRGYQRFVSPFTPPRCRFYPTCSHYAVEALEKHGTFKGSWLAVRRVLKCHPLHPGGIDLVPESRPYREDSAADRDAGTSDHDASGQDKSEKPND